MITNRRQIETAIAGVLEDGSIKNVRIDVGDEEIKYPVAIVHMVDETKIDPRVASDIGVDVMCLSIIGRNKSNAETHYEFVESVRNILSARGSTGLYKMLWGEGLPVGQVYETVDNGTEIIEEEGGSTATTTISVRFRLLQ